MKFAELLKLLKEQHKRRKDGDVEFWLGDKMIELESMGRFGFDGDIVFRFRQFKKTRKDKSNG